MLRELHIKNFAIIDDLTIEFGKGFNVLTGETGAGKSIIISALCLALGERATGEIIRSGEKEALVEAFFELSPHKLNPSIHRSLQDMGIDINDGILLRRIISTQGKSRAYVNNSIVNVQTLSEISKSIIDVHGQYEHQSLLSPYIQMELLDTYGGLTAQRNEFKEIYEKQALLKRQITELREKGRERSQRIDMLKFQIDEINDARLKIGEEEELIEEIKILSNAARLAELSNRAYESLYSSDSACLANLLKILNDLKEISSIDPRVKDITNSTEECIPLLEETAYFLRDYREKIEFSPERLDSLQERLELIKGLKKKYGDSIQEILEYREGAIRELDELQHSEERLEALESQLEELKGLLTEKARSLSEKRRTISPEIEQRVMTELSNLSMPDTRFSIKITQEKGNDTLDGFKATPEGIDKIEFLISPNPGEELKPLSKIASGGELSRVMLVLKEILASEDRIPVLVFDEIDAGIGGITARTVGQKLKNLSSEHQVICITHLPQIASYADTHLKIEKKIKEERTTVEIRRIEKEERAVEIARMLSGDSTKVSIKHAQELLKKHNIKSKPSHLSFI